MHSVKQLFSQRLRFKVRKDRSLWFHRPTLFENKKSKRRGRYRRVDWVFTFLGLHFRFMKYVEK